MGPSQSIQSYAKIKTGPRRSSIHLNPSPEVFQDFAEHQQDGVTWIFKVVGISARKGMFLGSQNNHYLIKGIQCMSILLAHTGWQNPQESGGPSNNLAQC